jgi:hypothetical protein
MALRVETDNLKNKLSQFWVSGSQGAQMNRSTGHDAYYSSLKHINHHDKKIFIMCFSVLIGLRHVGHFRKPCLNVLLMQSR